jgi:hypothetical protein
MDIQVKINGIDVTHYTISYIRNKKICTGIGTLQLDLSKNYATSIFPNDTVQIYENGSLVGTYIVNTENIDDPQYNRFIEAQDGSKRLTNYFIAEVINITSPTKVSYYIKKYITDCGLSYVLDSPDTTGLLPNGTVIGHMSAYEQIIQLLQLSNWYFYFDATNVCHLGKLTKDISVIDATFDRTDIINIKTTKDDKILRNRAVVWGTGNPSNYTWVFADVKVQTKWNHDSKDIRTAVFGSGNIPDIGSAYLIATQMINAFARINFTKEVNLWGARGLDVGNMVYISSNVYNGSGLITTYEVSMSKNGLITTVVLDEFCPRIFGWFDFGDYVYIGTNGSGVWRKHLKLDHTWTNFSTGLTNLTITDLYKNNGILSCVAADGSLFRRNDISSTWTKVPITNLATTSGVIITSGLMARATTQDRMNNTIHAVVDIRTEANSMSYGANPTGILLNSNTNVAWVIDVDPNYGNILASHPVNISGYRGFVAFDIDNDGQYDYVSLGAVTSGTENPVVITYDGQQYSFGHRIHERGSRGPLFTSLMASKDYNTAGQHVIYKGAGGIPNDYMTGVYATSMFIVDNKNDRGIAYYNENGNFYWRPVTVSGGSVSAGTDFIHAVPLQFSDTGSDFVRIVAIRRDTNNTNIFYIYYYTTNSTYDELWKNTVNIGDSSHSNTQIIHPFIKPIFTYAFDVIPWVEEREFIIDNLWYMVKVEYVTDRWHNRVYCVDLEAETQTLIWDVERPPDEIAPGDIFFWGTSKTCRLLPLLFQVGNDWNINYGYIAANGDVYAGDRYSCVKVCTNPFGTIVGIEFKAQGGPAQGNTDDFYRVSWVQYRRVSPETYYQNTTEFNKNGFSSYTQGPSAAAFSPWNCYGVGPTKIDNLSVSYEGSYGLTGTNLTSWDWVDAVNNAKYLDIVPPAGYTQIGMYDTLDSVHHYGYMQVIPTSGGKTILAIDENNSLQREILYSGYYNYTYTNFTLKNYGNWLIWIRQETTDYYGYGYASLHCQDIGGAGTVVEYINNDTNVELPPPSEGVMYLVAQRSGDTYQVVQSGVNNYYRLDISNGLPLVIVPSGEYGMGFIETCSGGAHHMSPSTNTQFINDFRYTLQDEGTNLFKKDFFYSISGSLYVVDISDLSNIDYNSKKVYYNSSSGNINHVETSNFQLPAQYIFVACNAPSGITFLQQDAVAISGGFIPYCTNLPTSPINIIRLDDRL